MFWKFYASARSVAATLLSEALKAVSL